MKSTSASLSDLTELTALRLKVYESILKITGSIQASIIPSSDTDIDKKEFQWHLLDYHDYGFKLRFEFKHPNHISVGGIDTLHLTFQNTELYAAPKQTSDSISSVPDGYTLVVKIQP